MIATLISTLPVLYATQNAKNPTVFVRYSHPQMGWQWFGTEFDGEDTFFGLVKGFETELGYFSKSELEDNGAQVDETWTAKPLSEVRK
jgi:hypothetical protein